MTDDQLVIDYLSADHVLSPNSNETISVQYNETILIPELKLFVRLTEELISCSKCPIDNIKNSSYCRRIRIVPKTEYKMCNIVSVT